MKTYSVGRFPHGCLTLFLLIAPFALGQSHPVLRVASSANADGGFESTRSTASPQPTEELITYVGEYDADGRFKPLTPGDMVPHSGRFSMAETMQWNQVRPDAIPPSVNLHPIEREVANFEPPSHAMRSVRGHSAWATIRDGVVTFAYGREKILVAPSSVTADSKGRVIVTDPAAGVIHVLDGNQSFRIVGGEQRRFLHPGGVAVDADNNIYVSDPERGFLVVYDSQGQFLRYIGRLDDESQFHCPTGIAIDRARGILYVLDTERNVMYLLDLEGHLLKRVGRFHGNDIVYPFSHPTYIAVGEHGVAVLDTSSSRINFLSLEGMPQSQFAIRSIDHGETVDQLGLAIDSVSRIYVSNLIDSSVRIYSRNGILLTSFGRTGYQPGEFNAPTGLCIAAQHLYVAEKNNRRVQVLQLGASPDVPSTRTMAFAQ